MSNRTPKEALREIRNRIVYMYGNIDGTFNPPALKEVCEIADDAISSPITEKSPPVGNAAAMREALEKIYTCVDDCDNYDPESKLDEVIGIADAAISAPARNCDAMSRSMCTTHFSTTYEGNRYGLCDVQTEREKNIHLYYTELIDWLFAPAAERKGEGDENK